MEVLRRECLVFYVRKYFGIRWIQVDYVWILGKFLMTVRYVKLSFRSSTLGELLLELKVYDVRWRLLLQGSLLILSIIVYQCMLQQVLRIWFCYNFHRLVNKLTFLPDDTKACPFTDVIFAWRMASCSNRIVILPWAEISIFEIDLLLDGSLRVGW